MEGLVSAVPRALMSMLLLAVGPWVASAQQHQQLAGSEPVRWSTIEIITNDFDSVERLREATGIEPGALLAIGDSRVQQACDSIRRELPAKVVQCTQLFGDKVDGYVDAEYIVEISDPTPLSRYPRHCSSMVLAPDLAALRDEWGRMMSATIAGPNGPPERVNAEQFLDYNTPARHELAARIHAIVRTRIGELKKASTSCTASSRANALYLMNFVGSPVRAIRSGSAHMDDPDPDVRNAATRLLGVFDGFISKSEVAATVKSACAMISGGFTDRNKSLVLLDRMRLRGLVTFRGLDAKCQEQIRNVARTSNAIQTGRAAQDLVRASSR
jgi:hypothetical protein